MQIAFAVFGVILAGLCPIVVAELRHVKLLESRLKASTVDQPTVTYYYVTPRANFWIQKLAGTATVTTSAPGPPSGSSGGNTVTIQSLDASPNVEDATAVVQVTPLVGH
jgi:hypothetical protein